MSLLRTTLTAGIACIAALILAAPTAAQAEGGWFGGKAVTGSGTAASEARAVTDFQAIQVHGPFKVVVRQTGREAVEVRADDNLLPLLETVVASSATGGRTLQVRWKRGETIRTRSEATVIVEVAQLTALSSHGSGDILIESLKTPRLALSLAGSGDARLEAVTADRLDLSVAGSGDVRAAGQADRLKVSVAGSGDIRALELKAGEVAVSIAGSGDVAVHADRTLDVSIAGSGDVVYRGGAALKSRIAGSGSISERR